MYRSRISSKESIASNEVETESILSSGFGPWTFRCDQRTSSTFGLN